MQSPVSLAGGGAARERHVAARVLNFSSVAPLLAQTDLLATLPSVVMHEALSRYGLCALRPPYVVKAMRHRFVWSARLGNDPANRWIRSLLERSFAEVLEGSDAGRGHRRR
ncbi:MAG: hypothetical protein IT379_11045 [Deltaproteobacteria bacterium]|nr:hypothetical protein [Deltaproteobacteria bacterium]